VTERSYTHMDRTGWGEGPWSGEPDKLQWIDEATGYDCLIVRSDFSGALCGYVGVPPGHPLHGVGDDDADLDVHGGLTFAGGCQQGAPEGHGVCHVPEPGRPADVWWLGFDCAHAWDLMPGMDARLRGLGMPPMPHFGGPPVTYKPVGYVREECARLAAQLVGAPAKAEAEVEV
jgi:hypothetical protein